MIEYLESLVVYDNPRPHVHSRHGYHPGLAELPDGELIGLFLFAEAFEAPNGTTVVSRSRDSGKTWELQGPVYDKSVIGFETTDTMKPCVLRDGTLVATGYRFHRHDPEQAIAIPETGGFQPGDNIVCFSTDGGHTWTVPQAIQRSYPELLELSGPCIETASGDLVATAGFYNLPDGSNPTGRFGVILRSRDKGKSWDDDVYFVPPGKITPWETRVCEMQPGRLVAIVWAYDADNQRHLSNRVTVSNDNGFTWSPLIDTGHMGQASNLLYFGGDYLVTIHAHRAEDPGIYIRIVDFSNNHWRLVDETLIWGRALGEQTRSGQSMRQMFSSLRFGQPSIMRLSNGEFIASHWSIEDGQGKIRAHRLRISID
ncbi:MAG TPA: sialidase family protein [Terriglobales bacterium]|nr:sialidase family protein [Terriglobales bacterium]